MLNFDRLYYKLIALIGPAGLSLGIDIFTLHIHIIFSSVPNPCADEGADHLYFSRRLCAQPTLLIYLSHTTFTVKTDGLFLYPELSDLLVRVGDRQTA